MSIDAYSLCPGGSGKKIKFCCPDMLVDLQKIDRMLQGDQPQACLAHIERLQEKEPHRACLMAIKGLVLRSLGRWGEARTNAETMVEKHPDNPTALAESAIVLAASHGGRDALVVLQKALVACDGKLQSRAYEAMGVVAQALLVQGEWLAGRSLLNLQVAVNPTDRQPWSMLFELNRMPDVPLLLKDDLSAQPCPDDAPWKDRFDEAVALVARGAWQAAADRFVALSNEVPDAPSIWRTLATVRARMADTPGCIEAMERLAATDVPSDEAVEAQAFALLLADVPLGDPVEIVAATIPVNDPDLLQAALATEPRAASASSDRDEFHDDSPPPRATYLFFDCAALENADAMSVDNVSRLLGRARLYGRQTDRQARLDFDSLAKDDLDVIREMLAQIANDTVDLPAATQVPRGFTSHSLRLLQRDWRVPPDTTPQRLADVTNAHVRKTLFEIWPNTPLGIFEGKSPAEVSTDPAWHRKLLAAVLVLECWVDSIPEVQVDLNDLRAQLGLPVLEPIDLVSEKQAEALPLVRFRRVRTETAPDGLLWYALQHVSLNGAESIVPRFAKAIAERETMDGTQEQAAAFRVLLSIELDTDKALEYLEKARKGFREKGDSCASWDLIELRIRVARQEGDHFQRLVRHIEENHVEETGVADAFTQLLVEIGLLRPDGSPAIGPQQGVPADTPSPPAAAPGAIWTPDGAQPGEKKKLWTPGQ